MKCFKFIFTILMAFGCVVPSTWAMQKRSVYQDSDNSNQSFVQSPVYKAIVQRGKQIAGVCAADTLSSLIEQATGADVPTQALICSAGLAGSLVVAKAIEKGLKPADLKDIVPSEIMTSHITRKPALAVLVALLGFMHAYADRLGVPSYIIYTMLFACKVGLFKDHKEAFGYASASSLYASLFALLLNYLPIE